MENNSDSAREGHQKPQSEWKLPLLPLTSLSLAHSLSLRSAPSWEVQAQGGHDLCGSRTTGYTLGR